MAGGPGLTADAAPLVVTLRLDAEAAARFTALRRAHFPPERNWLDAHVTLFHALPGAAIAAVRADCDAVAAATAPFAMRVDRLLFLGQGVAYALVAAEADRLRRDLARRWSDLLGRQDLAPGRRLHVTVQNKVPAAQARRLHDVLAAGFVPYDVHATGIDLWHYRGGPWQQAAALHFGG